MTRDERSDSSERSRSRANLSKFNIVVVLGLALRPKYLYTVEDKIGFAGRVRSENHLPRHAESFVATQVERQRASKHSSGVSWAPDLQCVASATRHGAQCAVRVLGPYPVLGTIPNDGGWILGCE